MKIKYNQRIGDNTIEPTGQLHKTPKLTDQMSPSFLSSQEYVSAKFKNIVDSFTSNGFEFIKSAVILKSGQPITYYIMHAFHTSLECLDAQGCTFFYIDGMSNPVLTEVFFESGLEFSKIYQENLARVGKPGMTFQPLTIHEISIQPACTIDFFPIFGVRWGGAGYFVSERLKDELLAQKCTGIIFRELNEPYP